jgi:hypothetical protein
MPNPLDTGSDTYSTTPDWEAASAPDDHQSAALTPDRHDRHDISDDLRDDTVLAERPAGRDLACTSGDGAPNRDSLAAGGPRTLQRLGIHAMGGAADRTIGAGAVEKVRDEHPHAAQRVGTTALTEAVDAAGDDSDQQETAADAALEAFRAAGDTDADQAATDEADSSGNGGHGGKDGPRSGNLEGDGREDDDGAKHRKRESVEPGTVATTQLRLILDKMATYGVKEIDDAAPTRVDLHMLQQRLDTAAEAGADTLKLDPAEVVELAHIEPQPSQLDKLAHFDDSETSRQPVEDRILTERALSLVPITQRDVLIRSNPMGGSQDTTTIAEAMDKTESTVQQQRWQAQRTFTQLADELERGELNLKEYGVEHPKSRSPLTLLARLDVDIPPDARMEELREIARDVIRQQARVNDEQRPIMEHLWGLYPGRHSVSTTDVSDWTGYRGTSILNIERVMLGLQSPDYHPERAARRQAR